MDEIITQIPTGIFHWIVIPLLIILARICDVSFGTVRIILIGKGYKNIAPIVSFGEAFTWIIAVSQIMQNFDQIQYYIAYAIGYALGTFIGMKIEDRLSLGQVVIRIITHTDFSDLIKSLKENNYNFTVLDAEGKFGHVKMIFMITQRHTVNEAIQIIDKENAAAFYSIEDIRYVKGNLPGGKNPIFNSLNPFQKYSMMNISKHK
jgi:uncharacterized protein YebE (UPF0316 family)